jgi:hypothetical protein
MKINFRVVYDTARCYPRQLGGQQAAKQSVEYPWGLCYVIGPKNRYSQLRMCAQLLSHRLTVDYHRAGLWERSIFYYLSYKPVGKR